MAPIQIYGMQLSAPCRLVEMTAEVLGLEYEFKVVDLFSGENMKPEYLALNPQHNIPCVKDGEFVGNESRAVAAYLASKYGKDDSLYPSDLETRYKVDQRLYFDMGVFYKAFGDLVYPVMFGGDKPGQDKGAPSQICRSQRHIWPKQTDRNVGLLQVAVGIYWTAHVPNETCAEQHHREWASHRPFRSLRTRHKFG